MSAASVQPDLPPPGIRMPTLRSSGSLPALPPERLRETSLPAAAIKETERTSVRDATPSPLAHLVLGATKASPHRRRAHLNLQKVPVHKVIATPPLRLRDCGPSLWTMPEPFVKAADVWEEGLATRITRTKSMYSRVLAVPCDDRAELYFERMVDEIRRARLTLPVLEKKGHADKWKRKAKKKVSTWKLADSIWAPRAKWADSKSFWDTDEVHGRRFSNDWKSLRSLGVAKVILQNDDGDSDSEDGDDHSGGDGEVYDCRDVLWEFYMLILALFMHYSASGDNIHTIGLNAWSDFTDDFALVDRKSQHLKRADLDRLFLATNTKGGAVSRATRAEKGNAAVPSYDDDLRALNRIEFMACLVHLAINKYVVTREVADVSDALYKLLRHDIQATKKIVETDGNTFRDRYCYTEGVDKVLRAHEPSLRVLFTAIAGGGGLSKEASLLSLQEYLLFVREVGLIRADLSERDARLSFSWSRMVVVNPASSSGQRNDCNLPFEGFLEALCRLATLKALPIDDEIAAAPDNVRDAGSFMQALEENESSYNRFLNARNQKWGGEPRQPIERCVDHLIAVIIRGIERETMGQDDLSLKEAEMRQWCKRHHF